MKANTKILALMTALAAGTASAEYTQAGTGISNTATATFTDPTSTTGGTLTSTSNTVNTTVLAKPDFDIIFKGDTPTDGGPQTQLSTTTKILTGSAGGTFPTTYTVKNDGNIALTVNIAADTTGATGTQTVSYYADSNKNGVYDAGVDQLLTDTNADGKVDVTVAWDDPSTTSVDEGVVDIFQVISIAAGAAPGALYGASPEGTVTGTGTGVGQNGYASGSTNYEQAKAENTDLQFTKVQLYSLDNNPNLPTAPTAPTTPGGTTYTPTPVGNVDVPTLPAGNTDTTINTPPVQPATGYPDSAGTPIVPNVGGDNQIAYPKADADNNPDVVTFTNTITNNGTAPDKVQLFPVDAVNPDGSLKTGYTFDATTGTFTYPDGTKVQFLAPDGSVISTPTGSLFPTFSIPAGSTVYYQTKVTYPDPNDSAPTTPIVISVGADSLNDTDVAPNATTTNTIYPAAAQFGDSTTPVGTDSAPAPVQTVTPYANYSTTPTSSPDVTDGTAAFPMDLVNNGQYTDSFKLTGSVPGIPSAVVKYYDALTGNILPKDSTGAYITPVVAVGGEYKVIAVIDVPQGTANGNYTVTQNATGNYSTIAMTDTNDVITVARPGAVAVAKFIAKTGAAAETVNGIDGGAGYTSAPTGSPTTALPGDTISYKIMVKNSYPLAVTGLLISDTIPANTTFKTATVSGVTGAKVLYKATATGTWSATVTTPVYAVAVDLNGDGAISAADSLPANSTVNLNLDVTVN